MFVYVYVYVCVVWWCDVYMYVDLHIDMCMDVCMGVPYHCECVVVRDEAICRNSLVYTKYI